MFDIPETKVFMDSVHGYINVPKCFVEHIIDTEMFQRLRNIDQTGMRILYPDAKHDRFGHSLGVFFLGCKAVDALLENFSKDNYWNISSNKNNTLFWAKNKVLFLLACLLHDIGHTPFSHALEKQVLDNSVKSFELPLEELICSKESYKETITKKDITASPHEQLGARYIIEKLQNNIENIFDDLYKMGYPNSNDQGLLYAEHYIENSYINKNDITDDICFIARMILGLKYKGYEPEMQIKNCFIELLNGNNFDVDKLDYILRDTAMSGISNIGIDVERLLNSINIITKTILLNYNFKEKTLPNYIVHYAKNKEGDFRIKGNFRGILKITPGSKIKIGKGSTFIYFKNSYTGNESRIKYIRDIARFSTETVIHQDGEQITHLLDDQKPLNAGKNNASFNCIIRNATVLNDDGFYVEICGGDSIDISINGYCDLSIKGEFKTKGSLKLFGNTTVDGHLDKIVIIGNVINDSIPSETNYNTFNVGFKKQAINIIANVLEARDYLYLWIYAHHKVIYYANFLIPAITHELFNLPNVDKNPFLIWDLDYACLESIDDYYIWTYIKQYLMVNENHKELILLIKELLERKYHKSLYKSLAEYDLLFESFTESEKLNIQNYLSKNINDFLPKVPISNNENLAGFICDTWLKELKENFSSEPFSLENIKNIIFVDASYRTKSTNQHETYIQFGDQVAIMDEIPLLSDRIDVSSRNTVQYFYLYFETSSTDSESIQKESNGLKIAIVNYFKNYFKINNN